MKLNHPIPQKTFEKLDKYLFIAKLAQKDQLLQYGFQHDPVDVMPSFLDTLQFILKIISPVPKVIKDCLSFDNLHFYGNEKVRENLLNLNRLAGNQTINLEQRKQKLRIKMEQSLFVVQLMIKKNESGENIYLKIVASYEAPKPISNMYFWIPSVDASQYSETTFTQRLDDDTLPVTFPDWFHAMEAPRVFVFGESLYKGEFRVLTAEMNCIYYPSKDIPYVRIQDWMNSNPKFALKYAHLYAVSEEEWLKINQQLTERGTPIHSEMMIASATPVDIPSTSSVKDIPRTDSFTEQSKSMYSIGDLAGDALRSLVELLPEQSVTPEELEVLESVDESSNSTRSEYQFIESLHAQLLTHQRFYAKEDLIKFHVSVKTNLLTILGGRAGTGKSELATRYAESLGLKWNVDALFVPVSPVYTEPNDILGYYHVGKERYLESETGLASFLHRASLLPDQLFYVIFDEMNLSQVEHWFSPFISLMDRNPETRELVLYRAAKPDERFPASIPLGSNVRMIGTVNIDETTKPFSDRLLDRVNSIQLRSFSFVEMQQILNNQIDMHELIEEHRSSCGVEFLKWVNHSKRSGILGLLPQEVNLLDKIATLLKDHDPQRGISLRVIDAIGRFLENMPLTADGRMMIQRNEAFDWQIQQRIITLLRGPETLMRPLVGYVEPDYREDGELLRLLSSAEAQSCGDFKHSMISIQRKAKDLSLHGYI